jgi:acyl carrier protein
VRPQLKRITLDGTGGPNLGLDTVELLWTVEETFGIKISDADAARMRTVGDLNQFIADQVAARASRPGHPVTPEPSLTWERLVPIVVEELGVRREQVSPDAEWARDLGAS